MELRPCELTSCPAAEAGEGGREVGGGRQETAGEGSEGGKGGEGSEVRGGKRDGRRTYGRGRSFLLLGDSLFGSLCPTKLTDEIGAPNPN